MLESLFQMSGGNFQTPGISFQTFGKDIQTLGEDYQSLVNKFPAFVEYFQIKGKVSQRVENDFLLLYLSDFFDESNPIDLVQRRHTLKNLFDRRFAQTRKAFFLRLTPDLRARAAFDDHFADRVGHVEQFVNGCTSAIAGVIARITAHAAKEYLIGDEVFTTHTGFGKFLVRRSVGSLASRTQKTNEALGENAV